MATANTYVNVKRVFNTQPEAPPRRPPLDVAAAANIFSQVLGFVVNVGEAVNIRMMQRPLMTCLLSLQA